MASGILEEDEPTQKRRWDENSKVYTRKFPNKRLKNPDTHATNATSASAQDYSQATAAANEDDNLLQLVPLSNHVHLPEEEVIGEVENAGGVVRPVVTRVDEQRVRINLEAANSKNEIEELRKMLVSELDQVRALVKQVKEKELQLTTSYSDVAVAAGGDGGGGYSQSQHSGHSGNDVIERRDLVRVDYSEVGHLESTPVSLPATMNNNDSRALVRVMSSEVGALDYRPFRNLTVSVMENNNHMHGVGEFVEKEKRTPKANQFYRNSDFLLGKDRLPPETNKKVKSSGGRKPGRPMEHGFGMDRYRNQVFKNCSNLLQRLMKHKHGWVFNEPVNAKLLGLNDYHDIIKHPMDLGTIKNRLAHNFYKSPRDFAEDVRLTFRNAMTYNPRGHDVHVMAEQLLNIFEDKWAVIDAEYNPEWRYEMIHYSGLQTPSPRKFPPQIHVPSMRALDRSDSMIVGTIDSRPKHSYVPVSRTPVPKKPKAKDPNKRDMTYDEKQKLSSNLQSLPSEKLDNIVQIIKKRNSAVSQHDDEIEVDIDNVDAETLWELDRFFTNYKKSLSKYKKKAELAQARAEASHSIPASNQGPAVTVAPKESTKADEINAATAFPVQAENQVGNVSRSNSSGTSSSDSGSSSSDTDTDSSSAAYGSDAGQLPRT